jgi:hypothetical protein
VTDDQTWPAIGVSYLVGADIDVHAALTIAAGAELAFGSSWSMSVEPDGSLQAVGTAGNRIVFTGHDQVPGYWGGLIYYYSNSSNNQLEYVTLEYGGFAGAANLMTVASAAQPTGLSVKNCTLRGSAGYGLYLNDGTTLTEFASNTLTGNLLGAASVTPDLVGSLDTASDYQGNTEDVVDVRPGSVTNGQTWPAIDVRYLIVTGSVDVHADLTIAAGATLAFGQNAAMSVYGDGSLRAVGTSAEGITFTGQAATAGYWQGLRYDASVSPNNVLGYATIEYGGGNDTGNLYLSGDAEAAATNCTFSNSSSYGVYVGGSATINSDIATANTFSDNALGDVFGGP